jgi:hypothetical protein
LKKSLITEASIAANDINKYSEIRLINAMLGLDDTKGIPVGKITY